MLLRTLRFLIFSLGALAAATVAAAAPAPAPAPRAPDESTGGYHIRMWQTGNGLPQNWVTSIAQTPDGYLWIGTRYGGLARFDGLRFVLFSPQNTPELPDTQINRLTVDSRGTMWIATADQSVIAMRDGRFEALRLPRANPKADIVSVLRADASTAAFNTETGAIARLDRAKGPDGWSVVTPPLAERTRAYNIYPAQTFHRDRAGNYWYVNRRRQLALTNENGEPLALPAALSAALPAAPSAAPSAAPPAANPRVNAIGIDAQGTLWIVTPTRILAWDGRTQTLTDHTPANTGTLADSRQIAFSPGGGVWIAGTRHLRKLSPATGAAPAVWLAEADTRPLAAIMPERNWQLYADSRGGAWIMSYGHGLLHARPDGATHLFTAKDGLPSALLTCWFEDDEGNIWVGTRGDGLASIRERAFRAIGRAEGMPEKILCSVGVDTKGAIWAGAISGQLVRWHNGKAAALPLPPADTTPLGGIAVWPSRSGDVWAGSLSHGLARIRDGKLIEQIPLRDAESIRVLFEDSRGAIWIGYSGGTNPGGLCRYTPATGKLDYLGPPQGFAPDTAVSAIAEDTAAGAIWIGLESGDLWHCETGSDARDASSTGATTAPTFTRYPRPDAWPRARCASLQTDAHGVVWMATLGSGLVRFQASDATFTRFRKPEGLLDNNISQLLDDHAGNLWCGTYSGIARIPKTEINDYLAGKTAAIACATYGIEDGLPALECTTGFNPACSRADDGRLLFTTVNGLAIVNPRDVTPPSRPPRVIIEELRVDGQLRRLNGPPPRAPLTIAPGKHFLQFHYTGLSYNAPEKVRFLWKLENVTRDWQNAARQRDIGVGPLPPGAYRLLVRAANSNGAWSAPDAVLAFRVLPHFWETLWFRVLAAAALLALIALAIAFTLRRRYHRRLREAERRRHLEEERARIARDLHDDLGTSLTQISLLSTLADDPATPPAEKLEIIRRVDTRAREMTGALDEIVWAVNPKNDTWNELAHYLEFYAEEFFRPAGIRCRMNIPEQLPSTPLFSETRHHLFLAFKEAINNVVKHSGATEAWIRMEVDETAAPPEVRVIVEDDGHGFIPVPDSAAPRPAGGNGLPNMRRRMEQIGGKCEITPARAAAAAGCGTRVVFHVPLG